MSIPTYRLINPQANRCTYLKAFGLTTPWHYHPELELIYFMKGKTTVIGEGLLSLIKATWYCGANFPHVLQEHTQFKRDYPALNLRAYYSIYGIIPGSAFLIFLSCCL